ncbi:hypothetical protein Tco_0682292 [Tanacetum coccineum]|uniref:Transposase n=1 Tax=Tanacetum coccineum TaxID=301880 RepID=A0ABQ4XQR3_9ASTR
MQDANLNYNQTIRQKNQSLPVIPMLRNKRKLDFTSKDTIKNHTTEIRGKLLAEANIAQGTGLCRKKIIRIPGEVKPSIVIWVRKQYGKQELVA